MPPFTQDSFQKLNRRKDPSQLVQGEYALLVNGRVRNGGVEPVLLPKEITSLPVGNLQGVYGYDKYLLAFVDGKAYVKDYTISSEIFFEVAGFNMSADAPTIYACAVPASTVNQRRIPTLDDTDVVITSEPVQLFEGIAASPACILCQDGVTQPFVIFTNGTSRVTSAYTDWIDETNREYVPIGKQMYYSPDGILYLVAQDSVGNYTLILHSVSGRPLDFMIIIDGDGDKLSEADGNATNVAYSVDYAEITCMSGVGANDGGFFVSTFKQSYLVLPDFTRTIYGEPKFRNQSVFTTGALNNNSIVDLLGDQALIDFTGIKSFNAILQTRFEGKNAPFSANIQPLFGDTIQSVTSAIEFDNYGLFAVTTKYGSAVLVWDGILPEPSFVAIDLYQGISNIKQFANIKTLATRALFFITSDNRLYEAFVGDTATARIYLGEFTPSIDASSLKPENLSVTFVDVIESGTVSATTFLDSSKQNTLLDEVDQQTVVTPALLSEPFGDTTIDRVRSADFDLNTIMSGWKVGFYISWNFKAKLIKCVFNAALINTVSSYKDQAREFVKLTEQLDRPVVVPQVSALSYGPELPTYNVPESLLAPTNLVATPTLDFSGVDLSWVLESGSDQTLVSIYRSVTHALNYQLIATIDGASTNYLDDGISEGASYYYVVQVTKLSLYSPFSNEASVNIAPASPSNLIVTGYTESTVSLSWANITNAGQTLVVQRSELAVGPFSDVVTLAANQTTYTDVGLVPKTLYYYRIQVTAVNGLSATSLATHATTLPVAALAPTLNSATPTSASTMALAWTSSDSSNVDNYYVYRAIVTGGPYTLVATLPVAITTYSDIGLNAFTQYFYVVKAGNLSGLSGVSNELSAYTFTNSLTVVSVLAGSTALFNLSASMPAGSYRAVYDIGAFAGSVGSPVGTKWSVQQGGTSGFYIRHNAGVGNLKAAGSATQYLTQAIAESNNQANTGLNFVSFNHTGGTIGLQYIDSGYGDNANGSPNTSYYLQKL